jgi:hypothetical protein
MVLGDGSGDDDSNNCGDDGGYDMYSINNYSFTFFIQC